MSTAAEMMTGGISAGGAKAINGFVNSAVSAAGTTISDATAIKASHSIVTTVGAGSGVILPNTEIGDEYLIYNATTTPLLVYPPTSSATVNQIGAGLAVNLSPYTACKYKKTTATTWHAWLSA